MRQRWRQLLCWLKGHELTAKRYQGRGKRVEVVKCARCGFVDPDRVVVSPMNRAMRRQWARDAAKRMAQ